MKEKENVLFLGCGYMGYDIHIIRQLEKKYNVYYEETTYSLNHYTFIFNRIKQLPGGRMMIRKFEEWKIEKLVKKVSNIEITKFLLIYSPKASISSHLLESIKSTQQKCDYILYLWDNWARLDKKDLLLCYFKKIYSFDLNDCETLGFKYRPLFYIENVNNENIAKTIDICCVGMEHSRRIELASKFKCFCISHGYHYDIRIVCGLKKYLFRKYIQNKQYSPIMDIMTPFIVEYDEYLCLLDRSKVVFDNPFSSQCGLTMRVIEALAKGLKVITTNSNIRRCEDIPSCMYFVLDDNFEDEKMVKFMEDKQSANLPERYSIHSFLSEIMA